jgi:hypothetical protein
MLTGWHAEVVGNRLKDDRTAAACGESRLPIADGNGIS